MSELCVAHLVREANGVAPLKAFLDSYRQHPAGVEHDLLFIFKGFNAQAEPQEHRAVLDGLAHRTLFVSDEGFDIGPYLRAAEELNYNHFCFLNSFSVIQSEDWLAKLYGHVGRQGVGVVGATGSHESWYSTYLREWRLNRPRRLYRGLLGTEYYKLRQALRYRARFPPFPNYHMRSNTFLIARSLMHDLKVGAMMEKQDAHEFESGRESLTRQILARNLRPLVVGRDGEAYEKEAWYESFTFRSAEQQNLLVADNQTRYYAEADAPTRRALVEATWGRRAMRPSA